MMPAHSISKISVSLLILGGFVGSVRATDRLTTTGVVEEKVYLERVLESKGQRALDSILGPRKAQITIVVDANPSATENYEISPGKKQEPGFSWRDPRSGDAILPGFHEEIGNTPVPPIGGRSSRISTVSRFIQRINGTIVADRGVSEEDVKNAREAIFAVLALDVNRGDTIQILRGNIYSEIKEGIASSLFTSYLALLFGIIGLTIVFVALKASRSLGASIKAAENLIRAKTLEPGLAEEQNKDRAKDPPSQKGKTTPTDPAELENNKGPLRPEQMEEPLPSAIFGTLGESSVLAISAFLADQPASKAAALISLISPETAGSVLEKLTPTFRLDVFKALGQNFNVSDKQKESLATPLADFVRSFVHGPHVLVEIYESAIESAQMSIAEDLAKTSPALLAEVQAAALKPDELWSLAPDQWVTLATELSAEDLAAALNEAPLPDRKRLAAALPGDLATLVSQHLTLGGTISPAKTVQARRKMFAAARALRQSGKITLSRVARA